MSLLGEINKFCSSSQERADACNDYDYWNTKSIQLLGLPLSCIQPVSVAGRYLAPIDRYATLVDMLGRVRSIHSWSELFTEIAYFSSLCDVVIAYGTRFIYDKIYNRLSTHAIRFITERLEYADEYIALDYGRLDKLLQIEIRDAFPNITLFRSATPRAIDV